MDRLKQIRSEALAKFFNEHGRMPNKDELQKILDKKSVFSPITEPMVPEHGALSVADYTREDLLGLIKDRNLIDDLLTNLDERIERVNQVSLVETEEILKKAENFFTDTSENDYGMIFNEIPLLSSEADVSEWYSVAAGADDLYIQDDGTSSEPTYAAQWIELDSFNVDSTGEGISISPSSVEKLQVSLSIGAYSETDTSILQTLSKINPISIIASGLEGVNKGIEIAIPLLDKNISTITLDTNAINCQVVIDGIELFTKSLDGSTTLSIASNVKEELKLILFDSPTQVHVIVRDLAVYSSASDAEGQYEFGQYVTLQVPLRSDFANVKFNPDEYVPSGTNIEWEWSPSRIAWNPMSVGTDGTYNRLEWNTNQYDANTISPIGLENNLDIIWTGDITGTHLDKLPSLYDYVIKQGKGCVLFVTKLIAPYQGFQFYMDVTDETGYTLELANAKTTDGNNVFNNISISGDEYNINQQFSETLKLDIPFGIYKIDITIADSIDLSEYDFGEKSILNVLEDDFGAIVNLTLGADRLGRVMDTWIQPYGLTPTDQHNMLLYPEQDQINRATLLTHGPVKDSIDSYKASYALAVKLLYSNTLYDVVPVDPLYSTTEDLHSGYELHYYSGEGSSDWFVTPYHTPVGDVTMNESGTTYTPAMGVITVSNSEIASTRTTKKEWLEISGDDPKLEFDLAESPISSTLSLVNHNLFSNVDLDLNEATDESFPTFFPKGRLEETFTTGSNWVANQVFDLTHRPDVGYCLTNGEIEPFIKLQDNCDVTTSTWITGYCSDGTSLNSSDCALEGYCEDSSYSDKASCEAAMVCGNGSQACTWTSTYEWKKYIKFTDTTGAYEYDIGLCDGGTATGTETRDECLALADYGDPSGSSWTDFDLDAQQVTVRGLDTQTFDVVAHYEYGELQNNASETDHIEYYTVVAADDIVLLNRTPKVTAGTPISIFPPNSNTKQDIAVSYDASLDKYKIDLNNYSNTTLQEGDIITIKYLIEYDFSFEGNKLTIDNAPNTLTTRKVYREVGTTVSPGPATTLTMEHPIAFQEQPGGGSGPNSNLYIEVNGNYYSGYCEGEGGGAPFSTNKTDCLSSSTNESSSGAADGAGTWTDLVSNVTGNIITLDLSKFAVADDSTQDIVNVLVMYESYEHTHPWRVEITYDYYGKDPYTFNYAYQEVIPMSFAASGSHPVYNNASLRDHFYDISIIETKGEDLYLKATLTSTGAETPIIRRLRFER